MDRFVYQEKEIEAIKIQDLICKDCIFRNERKTGICEMFPEQKPLEVFDGKCTLHKTE